MTVNELIEKLQEIPEEQRELPVSLAGIYLGLYGVMDLEEIFWDWDVCWNRIKLCFVYHWKPFE